MKQQEEVEVDGLTEAIRDVASAEEEWRTRPPRPPAWVFGWALARFRDSDLRLWPEQEEGYRRLRAVHGSNSGYNWDPKNLMPEEECARYTEQGRQLSSEQLWGLIRSGSGR